MRPAGAFGLSCGVADCRRITAGLGGSLLVTRPTVDSGRCLRVDAPTYASVVTLLAGIAIALHGFRRRARAPILRSLRQNRTATAHCLLFRDPRGIKRARAIQQRRARRTDRDEAVTGFLSIAAPAEKQARHNGRTSAESHSRGQPARAPDAGPSDTWASRAPRPSDGDPRDAGRRREIVPYRPMQGVRASAPNTGSIARTALGIEHFSSIRWVIVSSCDRERRVEALHRGAHRAGEDEGRRPWTWKNSPCAVPHRGEGT